MKNLLLLFGLVLFATTGFSQENRQLVKQDNNFAEFKKMSHNFGEITDEKDVTVDFEFVNTTGKDLILNPPKTSCGCTASKYPKKPIAPGATEVIQVKYSTKNRIGKFLKDVSVYAQGYDDPIVLKIKGEVKSPQAISTLPKKQGNSLFK